MLKRILRTLAAMLVVLVLVSAFFRFRYQIEAELWHWRHGRLLLVGGYEIPVPDHWLPVTFDDPNYVSLFDTRLQRKNSDDIGANSVTIESRGLAVHDLDDWASSRRQKKKQEGLQDVYEKTLYMGADQLVCIGGPEFQQVMHVPSPLLIMECQSNGGVSIKFVGNRSGLDEFYSIVSNIHKQAGGPGNDAKPQP